MPNATAAYSDETLDITFSGTLECHDEGDIVTGIEVTEITLCGVALDYKVLPEKLQKELLELADDLEFIADEPEPPMSDEEDE